MAWSFLGNGDQEGTADGGLIRRSTTRRRTVPGRPRGKWRSGSGNRRARSSRRPDIADLHASTLSAAAPVTQRLIGQLAGQQEMDDTAVAFAVYREGWGCQPVQVKPRIRYCQSPAGLVAY